MVSYRDYSLMVGPLLLKLVPVSRNILLNILLLSIRIHPCNRTGEEISNSRRSDRGKYIPLLATRSPSFYAHFPPHICRFRARIFMEPRNRFLGMNSASIRSLAGRYDSPIPTHFIAPINCFKIPALNQIVKSQGKVFR